MDKNNFDLLNDITKRCFESVEKRATKTCFNPPKGTVKYSEMMYYYTQSAKKVMCEERRMEPCV